MVPIRIPVGQQKPWFSFSMTLSGTRYNLEARYNQRMDRWFLSVYDAAMVPILLGIPLLVDRYLTWQYTTLRLPPGPFYVRDTSGNELQPGLASFLTTHYLIYADPTLVAVS